VSDFKKLFCHHISIHSHFHRVVNVVLANSPVIVITINNVTVVIIISFVSFINKFWLVTVENIQ